MAIFVKCAVELWAIFMVWISIVNWRAVVSKRGFEPHDSLLIFVGVGAAFVGISVWIGWR